LLPESGDPARLADRDWRRHTRPLATLEGMRRARRIVAALCALLVLELVFVGSGYACSRPDALASMADMGMAATPPTGQPVAPEHQAPCRFPWAPEGCQSMVPCAPSAIAVPSQRAADVPPLVATVPVLFVVTPPSVASPPELPPPRG
jgi:hypothetical protein